MKFQYLTIAIASFFLLALNSCRKAEGIEGKTTSVTINFIAKYNDDPFILLTDEFQYPDMDGNLKKIRFQEEFGFFMADLELLQAEGNDRVELKEIAYIDFGANSTPEFAAIPFSLTFDNVPTGAYKGIKFNVGVPEELNAEIPTSFGAEHPLSDPAYHWSGWGSYTFLRLDGCFDRDGNGLGNSCNTANGDNSTFTLHTGGNAAYRDMDAFIRNFTLKENTPAVFNFEIDVAKVLGMDTDVIDFGASANVHTNDINNPTDIALINKIMDNLAKRSITLKN